MNYQGVSNGDIKAQMLLVLLILWAVTKYGTIQHDSREQDLAQSKLPEVIQEIHHKIGKWTDLIARIFFLWLEQKCVLLSPGKDISQ